MDSLYWTSLNPKVKLRPTKKLFYNKYAYKVKLFVPCGNFLSSYISNTYRDIDAVSYIRKRLKSSTEIVSSLNNPIMHQRVSAKQAYLKVYHGNPTVLEILKKEKIETDIQFRVEEPYISLYHNDEQALKSVTDKLPNTTEILLEVQGITDSEHQKQLKPKVILDSKIPYKYKVVIRLTPTIRQQGTEIVRYLDSLGTEHAMYPDSFRLELQHRGHSWHTVTYFYCNDKGVLDFLNLICPQSCAIDQVYTLVPKKHK